MMLIQTQLVKLAIIAFHGEKSHLEGASINFVNSSNDKREGSGSGFQRFDNTGRRGTKRVEIIKMVW